MAAFLLVWLSLQSPSLIGTWQGIITSADTSCAATLRVVTSEARRFSGHLTGCGVEVATNGIVPRPGGVLVALSQPLIAAPAGCAASVARVYGGGVNGDAMTFDVTEDLACESGVLRRQIRVSLTRAGQISM